jgi:hypothetical protein
MHVVFPLEILSPSFLGQITGREKSLHAPGSGGIVSGVHCRRSTCTQDTLSEGLMRRISPSWFAWLLLCIPSAVRADEAVTPKQAAAKVGMNVTLHMKVQATGTSTGGYFDLISESTPQHADALLVRISPAVQEKFKELKIVDFPRHFRQKYLRVSGTVKVLNFTGIGRRPVIEIDDMSKIAIVDPEALYPLDERVQELYQSGKLFQRSAYKEVRAAFARRFETNHAADLRSAYGEDYDALSAWLAKNLDVKENFYTALTAYDDIPKALTLFKEIWKRYPATLPRWNQLAIATAVVWDQDLGIYDYKGHQKRVDSKLPDGMMDALENYKYLVDNEKRMPQPVALYPWEFLVFVVNHRTPVNERQWAFNFFQTAKTKSRSWHQEVPYDLEIIKREVDNDPSAGKPRLAGREYTLANLKTYGGVCAHQADFACRTAQSLGIPAVYCSGDSAYRQSHAWWMFVNVASATKDEIKFTLQSDGRSDGKDNYYTGEVLDPQTGKRMLDRDMERRLWTAGSDRLAKRLSGLIMRTYAMLTQSDSFGVKERVAFLDKCLKVSKYNDDAWIQFALLAKRGELREEHKKIALGHLATLNQTFANYPDFIWRIFDEMIEISTTAEKAKQYETVLNLFVKAKRPDLASDARLKLTEVLIQESKFAEAQTGLSASVRKFATEGRYVPKMLKKMEELAPNVKGGPKQVAQLYVEIIPEMIVYYRSDSNVYYKKMHEQAKDYFKENNLTQAETTMQARILQARALLSKSK